MRGEGDLVNQMFDLIAQWSVRIIGTAALAYGALWLVEKTGDYYWRRLKMGALLLEFWQWKQKNRPAKKRAVNVTVPGINDKPTTPRPDPHRSVD
jgi:hypothetical protein